MVPRDSTASTSSPPPGSYHSPWMSATRHSESPPQPARSHRPRSPASGTPRQVLAVQHAHRGRAKGGEPRSAIPTQSKCFPSHAQILQAHARKVPVSSSVDFDSLARATGGFSGADLQALLYNAHLELVHASISGSSGTTSSADASDEPVEYVSLGAVSKTGVKSRAEEVALQRRVMISPSLLYALRLTSYTAQAAPVLPRQPRQSENGHGANQGKCAGLSNSKKISVYLTSTTQHEIHDEHLHRVLKTTRPSVSPDEIKRLRRMYASAALVPPKSSVTDRCPQLRRVCLGQERRAAHPAGRGGCRGRTTGVTHVNEYISNKQQ